ncbi:DUF2225 domain-containing protein [Lachnospiraceae bacterium ZAX-1]
MSDNLFSGLEQFGLGGKGGMNIFENEAEKKKSSKEAQEALPKEEDFLLEVTKTCPLCDQKFKTKVVKSGKAKSLGADIDLRPRFQYIDTLKYGVSSCPNCGYTAMHKNFVALSTGLSKMIREQVSANFKPQPEDNAPTISYDKAINQFKLALFNSMAKKGKESEKAYNCLQISWLIRGKLEEMPDGTAEEKALRANWEKEETAFYENALEGFLLAITKETPPFAGMDQTTVDYLIACMSYKLGKYDQALKCLSGIVTSTSANSRMKDKARDLKDVIAAEKKSKK